ncbi:MAG TPA: DUF4199 domain-containing protein [Ferruginibacter sp.]|nr:DUF4199 domain-containing protein [Ferruginibacter sp.]
MLKNLNATQKGLVTGIVMIGMSLFFYYVLKLPVNKQEQYVLFALYTAGIMWSLFAHRYSAADQNFKSYFSTGFKTFIVVTLLMVVFTFIFFKFNTSYRDAGIAENNALLLKEGNHTAAEIESNAKQLKQAFMPLMVGIVTFKYLILGALLTVLGSGFLSRKKQQDI